MEKKSFNIDMGNRIRAEREKTGMSRERLAEAVDKTPRFIADVERGSVGVSVQTLKKICETLNISSDKMIWGETSHISIDERLKFVDDNYIRIIDKTVQCQLELIELLRKDSNKQT